MGTVLEKANKIKETKNKLKEAINDGGGQITNNTVFNDYANEIKDIYIDAINNGTENIYDNFPKLTGDGSEIILNTEEGPMKITLKGNTSQDGTPSPDSPVEINTITGNNNIVVENKNIFIINDFITAMSTNYQGTETIDNVECIALGRKNSTVTSYKYFLNCKENTQYTISFKYTLDNCAIYFKYSDNSTSMITDTTTSSLTSISVTSTANKTITAINVDCFGWFNTGSKILITDIQLEAGSTATEYVEHQEQNYPISLSSKNLLNFTLTASVEKNGITFTKNSDGSLTLNGTATTTFTQVFNITNQILNGTYTIKHNVLNGTTSENSYLSIQKSPSGNISDRVYGGTGSSTLSITEDTTIITASLYITSGTTFTDYNVGSQLEVGETATAYEPYYNIEYCKIGDYADQFFKNTIDSEFYDSTLLENEWYLKKNIGKVVWNGTENWVLAWNNLEKQLMRLYYRAIINAATSANRSYSDYLPRAESYANIENGATAKMCFLLESSNYNNVVIPTTNFTDVNAWKDWLSTHNIKVYYPLATPTYIQLSQADYPVLREQLDNLYNNAKSYSGATIIECSSINDNNETIQASIIALKNIDLIESE